MDVDTVRLDVAEQAPIAVPVVARTRDQSDVPAAHQLTQHGGGAVGGGPAVMSNSMKIMPELTLEEHEEGILAYYNYPISTGPLEGTNTKIKIKAMQRQAYGFRNREFYKLKIMGIHESQYALVG